jgi:hypothetical protein
MSDELLDLAIASTGSQDLWNTLSGRGDSCLLDGLWARPGRCASSRRNRQTSPRRRAALYCYCSIKKWEVSSNKTRRYLDCVGFAHRGGVY